MPLISSESDLNLNIRLGLLLVTLKPCVFCVIIIFRYSVFFLEKWK